MKNRIERDNYIYEQWDKGFTFKQISQMEMPSFISLSRIRVIVYGGPERLGNEFEKKIYHLYRMKYLELKNVHQAIMYVYENQPSHRLGVGSIRRVINEKLKEHKNKICK